MNLTHELCALATLAGNIDHAIGKLEMSADTDSKSLGTLQKVDFLRQSLECLAQYSGNIAKQVNGPVVVDPATAAQALPLRDLARGLLGQNDILDPSDRQNGQDVWLF